MNAKPLIQGLAAVLIAVLWSAPAPATRGTFSNQGFAVNRDGAPLQGTFSFTFRLYEAASGGSPAWEEVQSVAIDEGIYSAVLGAATPLPDDLADSDGLYLGIQIDGDSEMTPRLEFFTTPYALSAERADMALSVDPSALSGFVTASNPQSWTGAHTFQSDVDLSLAGSENFTISNAGSTSDVVSVAATLTDANSSDAFQISVTDNTSTSGSARGLVVETGDGSASLDAAVAIVHKDGTQPMTAGLSITTGSGGVVTTAIDVSSADIITGLALGSNDVTVGGVTLTATELSHLDGVTSNIQTQLNASGGDITAVTAGTGLSGGGATGAVTLSLTAPVAVANGGTGADLSATGGANQFVKQSSAGGVFSVGAIADADVPNTITVDLAAAATALAANPADCAANQFATTIAASGALTCAALTDADVPNALTIAGGTVNSSVIGGTTPAAITGTTVTANTSLTVGTGTALTLIKKVTGVAGPQATATSVTVTDADVTTASVVTTTHNVTPGGAILCAVDSLAAGSFVYKCTADPADTHTFNYVVMK